jgi:hypothetical protein
MQINHLSEDDEIGRFPTAHIFVTDGAYRNGIN